MQAVDAYGRVVNSLIRFCLDSSNKHIIWFWNLLKNHYDGIISYAPFHIMSGKMEGINRKIDTIRRDGYGYPDDEYFFLKIIDLSRCPSSAKKHDRLLKKKNRHIPAALYNQIILVRQSHRNRAISKFFKNTTN